jgi:hypothetical protein
VRINREDHTPRITITAAKVGPTSTGTQGTREASVPSGQGGFAAR